MSETSGYVPISKCLRLFTETVVCIWSRVGRFVTLAGPEFVQLLPDALGCHGNAFNSSSSTLNFWGSFFPTAPLEVP